MNYKFNINKWTGGKCKTCYVKDEFEDYPYYDIYISPLDGHIVLYHICGQCMKAYDEKKYIKFRKRLELVYKVSKV